MPPCKSESRPENQDDTVNALTSAGDDMVYVDRMHNTCIFAEL